MLCVAVDDLGNCTEVPVKKTRTGTLQINKKTVHIHFFATEIGVAIGSYNTIDSLQLPSTVHFEFQFPPPLNSYVYPRDVFVLAIDSNEKLGNLSSANLAVLCAELGHKALIKEDETAVYDVPAIPLQADMEDINDEQSEEDIEDDEDEIDDEIEESDDDEWREGEEDDSSTT